MKNKLPEGWEWKKLGEIAEKIHYGYTASAVEKQIGPKLLRITDIQDNNVNWETVPFCEIDEKDKEKYLLHEGNFVFARTGATVGKSYLLEGDVPESVFASYLIRVILSNTIAKKYVYYFFQSSSYWLQIQSGKVGAGQPNVNATKLSEITLPLPPLETQQKIVAILEKAEETKKLRAQADELTQKLLQSMFLEMFGDPVTNPMGWNTEKLEKLCVKIYGGGTPSKSKPEYYEGDIPWVTPKDMKQDFIQDSIDHISEKAIEESSTKLIPPYSLLMVIRSGILKHTLPIAINICKVTMNQDMKGFVFDDKLTNSFFMLYYFKIYQRDLLSRVRSVTADNLEFSQIKDIDVILPPIKQQQRFTTIVEQVEKTSCSQQQSSLEINNLFDALMQKAFTGELVS